MSRILLVDDDSLTCMSLGLGFASRGFDTEIAKDGLRAIDVGLGFRPDVIVSDWMLKGPLDGFDVTESLRAVFPQAPAVLITARDSLEDDRIDGLFEICKKPLDPKKFGDTLDRAVKAQVSPPKVTVGFLEIDPNGLVVYANAKAKSLLGLPEQLGAGNTLQSTFSYGSQVSIDRRDAGWLKITSAVARGFFLHGSVRVSANGSRFVFLLTREEAGWMRHRVVLSLLGSPPDPRKDLVTGTVLLVDNDNLQRRLAATQIKSFGRSVHSASSWPAAQKILAADSDVGVLLLDFDTAEDVAGAVEAVRTARPEVNLIGISTAFRKGEFEAVGVEQFLVKPVTATSFQKVIDGLLAKLDQAREG